MLKEEDLPCCCLNELQNEQISKLKDEIFEKYGIELANADIVRNAVEYYLETQG